MGYLKIAAKGVFWVGLLRLFIRAFGIVKIGILARLLNPFQLGLFGIASLVLAFLEIVTETGINVFFIQREGKLKDYIDTAWFVSILRGLVIFSIIFLFAPLISSFFNEPESVLIVQLIAVVALLRGFINPAIINLQKELLYKKQFLFEGVLFFIEAVFAIVFTLITKSAIGIVYSMILAVLIEILLSFLLFKIRPKLRFEKEKFMHVIRRGKWVTLSRLFIYGTDEGDDIVVGRIFNTQSLGLYQVAYKISSLPLTEVGMVFGKALFPIYAKISDDKSRIRKAYFKTLIAITILVLPFGFIFFYYPEFVIRVILGDQWLAATDILKALAIYGVIKAILYSAYTLFMSLKKQEYVSMSTMISFVGMFLVIFPMIDTFGVLGVAYSTIFGLLVSAPFTIYFLFKALR